MSWIDDINEFGPKDATIFVIGNKSDIVDDRKINFTEAFNFVNKLNLSYLEVSAKTGNNVGLLFETLTRIMVKREMEKDKSRKKKGKIDKSHVSANKNVTLENSMKLEKVHNNSNCCK